GRGPHVPKTPREARLSHEPVGAEAVNSHQTGSLTKLGNQVRRGDTFDGGAGANDVTSGDRQVVEADASAAAPQGGLVVAPQGGVVDLPAEGFTQCGNELLGDAEQLVLNQVVIQRDQDCQLSGNEVDARPGHRRGLLERVI